MGEHKLEACIFDLDGVIVDTAQFHFLAWKKMAEKLGVDFDQKDNERLKGVSRMRSLEIILEIGKKTLSKEEKEYWAGQKNEWFLTFVHRLKPGDIFPGILDLLDALKKGGLKIGLASSSKNAGTILNLLGITSRFDAIVDGTMIVKTKPDPEIFLLAAKRLGINPVHCVVLEDAEAGVEAALAAGMKCVGIGSVENLPQAHWVLEETGDFTMELLSRLEAV